MRAWIVAGLLLGALPATAQISPLGGTTGTPAGVQPPAVSPTPQRGVRTPAPRNGSRTLQNRFEVANTTHDGKLTQAQAAGAMPAVARNFDAIDTGRKGYVTIDDIRTYNRAQRAARKAAR